MPDNTGYEIHHPEPEKILKCQTAFIVAMTDDGNWGLVLDDINGITVQATRPVNLHDVIPGCAAVMAAQQAHSTAAASIQQQMIMAQQMQQAQAAQSIASELGGEQGIRSGAAILRDIKRGR